jgi:predicted ATPase
MIKSVRVQNFKSLRDVSVPLGLRNVLVGPNMSGKTNFIDVFRFLHRMCFPQPGTWGLANAFLGGFSEFTWKGGDSNLIVISLDGETVEPRRTGWSYEIAIVGDMQGSVRAQEERLTLSREGEKHELIEMAGGYRSLRNQDGQLVLQNIDAARSALEFEVPNWDGSFLRALVFSWSFYRLIPTPMRQINPAAAQRSLTEAGDNLSAWLMHLQTRHGDALGRIAQVCRDVFPDLQDIFTEPTRQATVTVASREKHLRRPVSLWQMSDGQLKFLALLSLILAPSELGASLSCIEEPENHLHPRLLETLIELLKQVQSEPSTAEASQVIVTTHSPYLVDRFALEEVIVFEKSLGATVLRFPKDRAHLRELLEREEVGLGDLLFSGTLASV